MRKRFLLLACCLCMAVPIALAQTSDESSQPAAAQAQDNQSPGTHYQVESLPQTPVYRLNVTARSTEAVNYHGHKGSTRIDFAGTDLAPGAHGEAKIESHTNGLAISAAFHDLPPARTFGPVYLTYVLWAITPEGRAQNLGELPALSSDGKSALHVTTDLQAFGLIVTAEPYFAVTRPSSMVVVQNQIRSDTKGWEQPIYAKFDALQKGEYTADLNAADLPANSPSSRPLDLLEAENAVAVAKATGASTYAPDTLAKAQQSLNLAENYYQQDQGKTPIATSARAAAQAAEDARLLTIYRKQADQRAAEKQETQDARLQAQQEQQQRIEAEQAREQAEQQKQQAAADAEQARLAAQQADQARIQAQRQTEQLRQRLLLQLNEVLETRMTARGLVANMPDVLFDTGKSTLKQTARERLAKVAGIVQAYPGLRLQVEGYTDSTGTPELNQRLSEERAAAVRSFLVSQGVSSDNVVAEGFGEEDPVASNDTADGRRLNRRVDLVVTGTAIGVIYVAPTPAMAPAGATTAPSAASYDSGAAPAASATPMMTQPAVPSTPAAVDPSSGVSQPPPQ